MSSHNSGQISFNTRSRSNLNGSSSSNSQIHLPSPGPPVSIPPLGFQSRKSLPIKKQDAEPLTREDVQYDFLHAVFADTKAVFTNPRPTPGKPVSKITFRELYIGALYNSVKCSKVLKDKMSETPAFAVELAKISLLTNVGRINTTMAFFPEMKTALRTYHAIPSLQKTDGNAQDAPRIKNCLKAALLPSEIRSVPPSTPAELKDKLLQGRAPSTSVVNLVFILSVHAATLAPIHFSGDGSLNFLELFLPRPLSSDDRARVFLWHMYHYLESMTSPNPFDDQYSREHEDKAPLIRRLRPNEAASENVDTEEEIAWGKKMAEQRNIFLRKLVSSQEYEKRNRAGPHASSSSSVADFSFRRTYSAGHHPDEPRSVPPTTHPSTRETFMYYVPPAEKTALDSMPPPSRQDQPQAREEWTPPPQQQHHHRHYIPPAIAVSEDDDIQALSPDEAASLRAQRHSMLKHAWNMVNNTDPLLDSDEEIHDNDCRTDYRHRTKTVNRLLKYGR